MPIRRRERQHRQQLRAQGQQTIPVWAPDVYSPAFRSEAHRQSTAVAASSRAPEDQAVIDAVSDWGDE